jgi:hypothetical protein
MKCPFMVSIALKLRKFNTNISGWYCRNSAPNKGKDTEKHYLGVPTGWWYVITLY